MRKLKYSNSNWMERHNGIVHKLIITSDPHTHTTLCGIEFGVFELLPTKHHLDCKDCKTLSRR